ncbi:transmembrane protein, putative (macronuclear) [Tetrahymena thermophila SB210]|uniref:Transmembrane protein, putative n=1 Tax=Tetrahymena thermophila (strain SB210) TaxID=312017 RepID=I7LXH4_TETTS|nr:transmembrane protein, putative [Tetrahymena thermophila SB210]EAS04651.3 transmembrane protein, putative [Tetrahymena thermophila SB210]|eukprot:XP_001024896.3 transmembrane protein, putative [Tetrahymena thermophila SB210]
MAQVIVANAVNLAIIIVLIALLIKMYEKVSRRSQMRTIDASNSILEQIKNYVIDLKLKKVNEQQQEATEHQIMQNERKMLQQPGVRKSAVTTSFSHVNMNNPTRMESRLEKNTIDLEAQQEKLETPKNKGTLRKQDDLEKVPAEMNSKIKQVNIQTPPRPTARKINHQNQANNSETITSSQDDFLTKTLLKQLFYRSVRQYHSLGSILMYFYSIRKYRNLLEKGEQLFCSNPAYDLDIISHIFQYICYFVYSIFIAVCIYHSDSTIEIGLPLIIILILTIILHIFLLYLDLKFQKNHVKELQSSTKQQAWESIAIQQEKQAQAVISNSNNQEQIVDKNNNQLAQPKKNIPHPPVKNQPLSSRRVEQKRPNSGISTFPMQCENANVENQQVIGAEESYNNNNGIQQSQLGNAKTIAGSSFQNQNGHNNHGSALNRDSSKSSGVHSISQNGVQGVESNNLVIQSTEHSTFFDVKDEVQIVLQDKSTSHKLHGCILLFTVLLGGIGSYLLFNTEDIIGGYVLLTCFFVALIDFVLRYFICGAISVIILMKYKLTKNIDYVREINEEINWVMIQINHLEKENITQQQEVNLKSPEKMQAVVAQVKSPSKSVRKIMESLKKIVSPSKKRYQNSPMKECDMQQDEIQFLPNYNNGDNIPIKHLIFNQEGKNAVEFDTQTQHDYSINNVSVNNPMMQRISLIRKANNQNNQSQESIDIHEEIAIKKVNITPASQAKNHYSSKKPEQQLVQVKDFTLDSHRNNHIKILSDRNQNSLRQESSKNGVINFDDSEDTYIDSINLQPEPQKEKNNNKKNKGNSRKSSIGQIAPLPSQIIYNNNVNNSLNNNGDGEIHSGSLCGKKKSQRSARSKKDFQTSIDHQNKEFASRNKMMFENTQNEIRTDENIDNSIKPLKAAIDQGYRDSSFLHNRSINGCDQSHIYTAGDITNIQDQSNILPININQKNDGSMLLGEINHGMQAYVNNTILDPNESINAHRNQTWDKNTTLDNNNTIHPPSSSENRYIQDSKDRLSAIQTRNIQQQLAMKQKREQLKNKSAVQDNQIRNKSEDNRLSISQNAEIHIDNQKQSGDLLELQNKKISLSVGNFYENPLQNEKNFSNKLHKESKLNNLISQAQLNQLSQANSLSFLHNQTQNDGTMIMQQQQKDLSIFFNNISDNENSVQVHPTSPERKRITIKKPLSPIPPTDLKANDDNSDITGGKSHNRQKIFDTDGDCDEEQSYDVQKKQMRLNNLMHPSYNIQQIKSFDMNTSEQSVKNNNESRSFIDKQAAGQSILNKIDINEKNLQSKSLSNGKIMKNILEQNRNKENYNMRSYDFENNQGQSIVPISNPGSRKNSSSTNVPLKNIVKKKDWEKMQSNSPYLEFLPSMLSNQTEELKERENKLKSKLEKSKKNSRRGSNEATEKMKQVSDIYGFEIQRADQKNVLVSKKSARSVKSQESKRTLDNKLHEEQEENQKSILHDNTNYALNENPSNIYGGMIGNNNNSTNIDSFYNQKKQYPHQQSFLSKSKKPPLSSQNNILNKNLMLKENNLMNYPNSARLNLNSIALRQTTTLEGHDMSTMEHNIATQSNHEGFFNNQEFVIKPNNQNSIQLDIANSDRQHHKSFNDEFDLDAQFQQFKDHDNSISSFEHSHFGNFQQNKHK